MPLIRDLSARGRLRLTGPDRVRFLHGMVTNDVLALRPGEGCHAAMLTVKGKMIGDLVIYADEDALLVETDPDTRDKIRDVLRKHMIMDDVSLVEMAGGEQGVYGDDAAAAISSAIGQILPSLAPYHHVTVAGVRVAATPELGRAGFHVFGDVALDGERLDDAAFEVLRVEAGTPRYGVDMDEDRLPLEAGLLDAISFTKGCYLGQEVIARATSRGHINRKLVGLLLDGAAPAARGATLAAPARPDAGLVTSSVFSPRLGRAIALAYVHRTCWEPGTELALAEPSGSRVARVVALPFAPS